MQGKLIASLTFVAVLATGCGGDPTTPGTGPSASADPDGVVGSTPGAGGDPNPSPSYTEPQPGQEDVRAIAWDSYNADQKGRLYVSYYSGVEPCYVLDRIDVVERETKVTVTLWEGHAPGSEDVACIEIAELKTTVIQLEEPLGDRKLLDGAAKHQK
jgi:hypothetical protein